MMKDLRVETCGVSVSCDNKEMLEYKERNKVGRQATSWMSSRPI